MSDATFAERQETHVEINELLGSLVALSLIRRKDLLVGLTLKNARELPSEVVRVHHADVLCT